jgi:hypothetical protein
MPYKQKPGRGPMMKTGRGLRKDLLGPAAHEPGHNGDKKKPEPEYVNVPTAGADGKPYEITVGKGSGFHKLAKKMGGVPNSFRNISGLTEKNDPFAAGRDPREKKRLMDSIHKAEMKKYKNSRPATAKEAKNILGNL